MGSLAQNQAQGGFSLFKNSARYRFSLGLVFVVLDRECLACDVSLVIRESKN